MPSTPTPTVDVPPLHLLVEVSKNGYKLPPEKSQYKVASWDALPAVIAGVIGRTFVDAIHVSATTAELLRTLATTAITDDDRKAHVALSAGGTGRPIYKLRILID